MDAGSRLELTLVLGKPGDDITITICNIKEDMTWEACCGAGQGAANCCDNGKFTIGNLTHEYALQRPWNVEEALASTLSAQNPFTASPSTSNKGCIATSDNGPFLNMSAQIGVTAGLAIPLLISIGLLFLERRKRRHIEKELARQNGLPSAESEQEEPTRDTMCRHEVNADLPGIELSSQRPVHELSY